MLSRFLPIRQWPKWQLYQWGFYIYIYIYIIHIYIYIYNTHIYNIHILCIRNTKDHFKSRWNNNKSNVRNVENGNMENIKPTFLENLILRIIKDLLEEEKVRLTDKMQFSDYTKQELH